MSNVPTGVFVGILVAGDCVIDMTMRLGANMFGKNY